MWAGVLVPRFGMENLSVTDSAWMSLSTLPVVGKVEQKKSEYPSL